jgi:hypothetical protein
MPEESLKSITNRVLLSTSVPIGGGRGAEQKITLSMTRYGPVCSLNRALTDQNHVLDLSAGLSAYSPFGVESGVALTP